MITYPMYLAPSLGVIPSELRTDLLHHELEFLNYRAALFA